MSPAYTGMRIHSTWYGVGDDGKIAVPLAAARDFGRHAVLVVGYRDGGFIVQNSWGTDWGHDGFGYIESTYVDDHGIAAWALSTQIGGN